MWDEIECTSPLKHHTGFNSVPNAHFSVAFTLVLSVLSQDWRVHVEQMHHHNDGINTSLRDSQSQLDRLQTEISRTLEKIGSREKYINSQLEQHLNEFRALQDQLAQTKERYRQGSGGVTERAKLLAEVRYTCHPARQATRWGIVYMSPSMPSYSLRYGIHVTEHAKLLAEVRYTCHPACQATRWGTVYMSPSMPSYSLRYGIHVSERAKLLAEVRYTCHRARQATRWGTVYMSQSAPSYSLRYCIHVTESAKLLAEVRYTCHWKLLAENSLRQKWPRHWTRLASP